MKEYVIKEYVILSLEQRLIPKAHKEDHFFALEEFGNGLSYWLVLKC